MLFKNARIFTDDDRFVHGSFRVENGIFTEILDTVPNEDGVDLAGAMVIPGLIDVHIHGCVNVEFSDADYEGLVKMAQYLAQNGITSFAPASLTLPYDRLEKAFVCGAKLKKEAPDDCARIVGIHMEGPFFSEKKKGGQNPAYLQNPDFAAFEKLYNACDGLVRIVDLAPELPNAVEFTEKASKLCTVSVAHTDANYDEAASVFDAGATHLTHLFNAMPPIGHRNPGVIGAASERGAVRAELICDGLHVHPSAVRMGFSLFSDRICMISDALCCCGMPDGAYVVGEQTVCLENGVARLASGTIAGAATNLYGGLKNAVSFGIPLEKAIVSATKNPAKAVGCDDKLGSIAVGKYADFIVCDENLTKIAVYLNGKKL